MPSCLPFAQFAGYQLLLLGFTLLIGSLVTYVLTIPPLVLASKYLQPSFYLRLFGLLLFPVVGAGIELGLVLNPAVGMEHQARLILSLDLKACG